MEPLLLSPGCHEWLLSDAVDVLPFLLLPLAGPEELTEEENEGERNTYGSGQNPSIHPSVGRSVGRSVTGPAA